MKLRKNLIIELSPKLEEAKTSQEGLNSKKIETITAQIQQLSADIENVEKLLPKDEVTKLNDLTENIRFEIQRR
ncbi:MAG: hypothetical protein MZV70_01470 [Desulfobacterales bacterium]|nr:hypothetical protein [Desulfobacterales bacterium]